MLVANLFGTDGIIVVVIALIVVFGGSQLPKIARNVGAAGKEFKKGQQVEEDGGEKAPPAAPPAPQMITPPAPQMITPPAPAPTPDTVTLSKADLDAIIEQRLASRDDPSAN
ncbi:MAG: twin-arginine translocase TatA/TatE family subunit [Actinomycetota bacterium]|nr:twin-arginine translocase TatA/TatE family subunit [Actinomycetota bacterium]